MRRMGLPAYIALTPQQHGIEYVVVGISVLFWLKVQYQVNQLTAAQPEQYTKDTSLLKDILFCLTKLSAFYFTMLKL